MCGINNQNPVMNPANNAMGNQGPFGGNAGPIGGNTGPFGGGNAGPFGANNNPLGGLLGSQGGMDALIQIITILAQALQGGGNNQPQQQNPNNVFGNNGAVAPNNGAGAFGPNNGGNFGANNGVAFGPNLGGAIGPNNGGQFANGPAFGPNLGGNFGPNNGVAFGANTGGAIGPNLGGNFNPNGVPQQGPFGPNGTMGSQGGNQMNTLMNLITQLTQILQGGNTAPNGGQQGPFGPNGGPNGGPQGPFGPNGGPNGGPQGPFGPNGGPNGGPQGPFGPNGGPNGGPQGPFGPNGGPFGQHNHGPFNPNGAHTHGPNGQVIPFGQNGQNGQVANTQGGRPITNQNNNGAVNQTVIVLGDNNGVIRQKADGNANGAQGPQGPRPQPLPFNQPQQPMFNEQDQKAIDHINGKNGQWLVGHGDYKKDGDNFQINKGPLKDYVVKPGDGKNYNVFNPQGQQVGQYEGKKENKIASPIALDMNGDGKIATTGATTAKDRLAGTELGETRQFDIDNNGTLDNVEWMTGDGDALLTDEQGTLFGDEGGKYGNGYEKLALRDADKDGQLTGAELNGLQLWTDNGDAIQTADEMVSAADAGVTRLSVDMALEANARGENLMRADATINGQQVMSEDVWFGKA